MLRGAPGAIALLLLTICLPVGLAAQDPQVSKLMDSAQSSFEKGRYQDAFEKYQRAHAASGGTEITAVLGALESSLALGRYDGIITAAAGASSEVPDQQAHLDALIGRSHLLTTYVLDPSLPPANREQLKQEHLKRAEGLLQRAADSGTSWAERSKYYLAEVQLGLGKREEAMTTLEAFFAGGGRATVEAVSAESLKACLDADLWIESSEPPAKVPSKQKGSTPRRAADGATVLAAVMSSRGELQCLRLLPPLSERANEVVLDTMSRWRYHPAENAAGEPIATPYAVTLDFTEQ